MKRRHMINIFSALVVSVLALQAPAKVEAATAMPCVVCGEQCQNLLAWCEIGNCESNSAWCGNVQNADCDWDWDDNDDAIMCGGELET